jgi:hypothetical protein|tara:strand:- start:326 stop:733 length:408 start_codon:yes stop_codon:yes gene_type:complete
MELEIRRLKNKDWDTLTSWWDKWPGWKPPPKDFLPDNGTGGFIVEKNNVPIVAGFMYFTNSEGVLLEWIVSNPSYKDDDRQDAIEFLILTCEEYVKAADKKYIFSIGRNKHLMDTHKKLGYHVDAKASYEIIKKL